MTVLLYTDHQVLCTMLLRTLVDDDYEAQGNAMDLTDLLFWI